MTGALAPFSYLVLNKHQIISLKVLGKSSKPILLFNQSSKFSYPEFLYLYTVISIYMKVRP